MFKSSSIFQFFESSNFKSISSFDNFFNFVIPFYIFFFLSISCLNAANINFYELDENGSRLFNSNNLVHKSIELMLPKGYLVEFCLNTDHFYLNRKPISESSEFSDSTINIFIPYNNTNYFSNQYLPNINIMLDETDLTFQTNQSHINIFKDDKRTFKKSEKKSSFLFGDYQIPIVRIYFT